jgi:uncharacterized protein
MKIFVDADSCPREIRRIIMKAGAAWSVPALFVANTKLPDVEQPARCVLVAAGDDVADGYIMDNAEGSDLVITRDIPLAAELARRGITVINDRGDLFSGDSVGERLSLRNHMQTLREYGMAPGVGGKQYGPREKKRFADTFNRELTRLRKKIKAIP